MTVPKQGAFKKRKEKNKPKQPNTSSRECTPPNDWHMHNDLVLRGLPFRMVKPNSIKTAPSDLLAIEFQQLYAVVIS